MSQATVTTRPCIHVDAFPFTLDPSVSRKLDAAWARLESPEATATGFTPPWLATHTPIEWSMDAATMRVLDNDQWQAITDAAVVLR